MAIQFIGLFIESYEYVFQKKSNTHICIDAISCTGISNRSGSRSSTGIIIPGGNFDLNIRVDPLGIPIAGIQTDILYDSSLVKINTIKEGNLFTQNGANSYFNSGIVNNFTGTAMNIYSFIFGQNSIFTPGTFIVVNMTATGIAGTSKINLSNVKISDPNGTWFN